MFLLLKAPYIADEVMLGVCFLEKERVEKASVESNEIVKVMTTKLIALMIGINMFKTSN